MMKSFLPAFALLVTATPLFAADIARDAAVVSAMVENMAVTELTSACPSLEPDTEKMQAQAVAMVGDLSARGYGSADIAKLQQPEFIAMLSVETEKLFAAKGVAKQDVNAMCAFGIAEIAAGSSLGGLMKNR